MLTQTEQVDWGTHWIKERIRQVAGEGDQEIRSITPESPTDHQPTIAFRVERVDLPTVHVLVLEYELEDLHSTASTRTDVLQLIRNTLAPRPHPPLAGLAVREIN